MNTWDFADLCIAERERKRLGKLDIPRLSIVQIQIYAKSSEC